MTGNNIRVDSSEWEAFVRKAPNKVQSAAITYFRQGGQLVKRLQQQQAKERFGKEQAQSGMKTRDPKRPKGHYRSKVKHTVLTSTPEARIGPDPAKVPYAGWIERGAKSPYAPRKLRRSSFRGHGPVRHASEEAHEPLTRLFKRVIDDALEDAT